MPSLLPPKAPARSQSSSLSDFMKTSMTPETAEGLRGFNLTGGGELDDARSASLRMRAKMVVFRPKTRDLWVPQPPRSGGHANRQPNRRVRRGEAPPCGLGTTPREKALVFGTMIRLFGRFQRRECKQTLPIAHLVPPLGSVFTLCLESSSTDSNSSRVGVKPLGIPRKCPGETP